MTPSKTARPDSVSGQVESRHYKGRWALFVLGTISFFALAYSLAYYQFVGVAGVPDAIILVLAAALAIPFAACWPTLSRFRDIQGQRRSVVMRATYFGTALGAAVFALLLMTLRDIAWR